MLDILHLDRQQMAAVSLLPFVKFRFGVPSFTFSAWNEKILTPLKK